ncbi:MAG TPA: MATE family efflux transporter, partial [Anaeromyxobacter sp.]|nr:MATE family efflux transporter [Anaeromyxobacter sp.]
VSSFSSQLFGMGDLAAARRHGWYGLAVAGVTQVLVVAALPFIPAALGHLEYAPDVRAQMEGYLSLRLLSAGAVVGIEALGNYYGGLGNTRPQMRASVAAMILTVAGNWLLIDGRLGAPALGVRGAALSNTISTTLAFLGLVAMFVRECRVHGTGRLRRAELGRLLRFGIPSGITWFLEFGAYAFFVNVVVAGLGTTSLAALLAVIQVNSVAFMPAWGLASAGAILVGQAIGAGRHGRVGGIVRLAFAVAAAWECVVALAYLTAPELVLSAFARDPATAEAFVAAGRRMLVLSSAWQLFDAIVNVLAEALRAAGDTRFTMWARIAVAWIVWVGGSFVSVRLLHGGDVVAIAWLVVYLAVLAAVLLLRFRSGAWRRIVLVEPRLA